jgi:hypothetical protein
LVNNIVGFIVKKHSTKKRKRKLSLQEPVL